MENYNPFSLDGKKILVTGASSGIGRAIAIECSRMGATLVICGRNEERLNATLAELSGTGHETFVGDLTDTANIEALVGCLDKVDGTVLCAGTGHTTPLQFASPEIYDKVFSTNFFSTVETMRQIYKKKKINKGGSIVLISSVGGNTSFNPGNGVYGASKAALSSSMKFAAQEFAMRKVRVNAICPGMVTTPLIAPGTLTAEQLEEDAQKYPLKRYGRPEEIAYAAIYLLSDASAWVTGISLTIDGGMSI